MSNLLSFVLSSSRDGCFRQSTEVKNESQHGPCAGRNGESGVFCNKMCSCTPTSSPVVSSAVGGCCLGGRYDVIHRSSPDHRETDGEQPQRTEENLTASLLSSNTSGKEKKTKTTSIERVRISGVMSGRFVSTSPTRRMLDAGQL